MLPGVLTHISFVRDAVFETTFTQPNENTVKIGFSKKM